MARVTHLVDIGNYTIQSFTKGAKQPLVIRSMRTQLRLGDRVQNHKENSPIVVMGDGRRFHFGSQAYKYTRSTATAIDEKTNPDVFMPMLLSTLAPMANGETNYKADVHVIVPNPFAVNASGLAVNESLSHAINGVHRYTRNGEEMNVELRVASIDYEGLYPALAARRQGLVSSEGYTLVIDIGGGTWNTLVIDQDGDVIDQATKEKAGGIRVASLIQENALVQQRLGDIPQIEYIMDGIANRTNTYCDQNHIHWIDVLPGIVDDWWNENLLWTKSRFKPHFPKVKGFLFIGGNANLLEHKIKGSPIFAIYPRPEMANLEAMRFVLGL